MNGGNVMSNKKHLNKENKVPNIRKLVIILMLIFIVLIIFICIKYYSPIIKLISDTKKFRNLFISYGNNGKLLFIGLIVVHVIFPIIPGEIIQIAGGYIYGTVLGSILLFIGTTLGSIIVFYISNFIGYPVIKTIIGNDKIKKIELLLDNKQFDVILFIIFFIPGIPKDTLLYIFGITPIKPLKLLLISTTARIPS
jgi:uncharacterized membrane protein YdjX (TVP38/TMEM64 family)